MANVGGLAPKTKFSIVSSSLRVGKPVIPFLTLGEARAWYKRLSAGEPAVTPLVPLNAKSAKSAIPLLIPVRVFVSSAFKALAVGFRMSNWFHTIDSK